MLIHNYGLYWRSENVFWGRQKNPGSLIGLLASEKKSDNIDFREQSGIYALYADYDLIYVGQTGGRGQKLLARLSQHRKDDLSGRWNMFSWFGTRSVLGSNSLKKEKNGAKTTHQIALNHLEAILIHVSEPALNRQGGKWGNGIEQYLQVRDVRLGLSDHEMIHELWNRSLHSTKRS